MITVYLAGAIDKNKEHECRQWRNLATWYLNEENVKTINPIEGKELDQKYSATDIVNEDLESIDNSDIVLAEVGIITPNYPYIGTSMEIMYSWLNDTPVYCWTDLEDNLFLDYHVTYKSEVLEDALKEVITEVRKWS